MENSIISEGKTTNEAIEKGLKTLNVSRDRVNIKALEDENKRSFFSILTPRVVKVEMTLKEEQSYRSSRNEGSKNESPKVIRERREIELTEEEQTIAESNVKNFLDDFIKELPEGTKYKIEKTKQGINVDINSSNLGFLIGYRGETLYAVQNILSAIANKKVENKVRVILDIEGYKSKRVKTLEELAEKVAKTVMKTRKSITLEPMQAYERKIIHSKLQENNKIETKSIGEEPKRRIIVSLKR